MGRSQSVYKFDKAQEKDSFVLWEKHASNQISIEETKKIVLGMRTVLNKMCKMMKEVV